MSLLNSTSGYDLSSQVDIRPKSVFRRAGEMVSPRDHPVRGWSFGNPFFRIDMEKNTRRLFFCGEKKNLRFHTVNSGWLWMESGFALISLSLAKPCICVPLIRPNFFGFVLKPLVLRHLKLCLLMSYPTNHLGVAPYQDANQPPGSKVEPFQVYQSPTTDNNPTTCLFVSSTNQKKNQGLLESFKVPSINTSSNALEQGEHTLWPQMTSGWQV